MRFSSPTAAITISTVLLLLVCVSSFQTFPAIGRNTVRTQQRWPPKPVTSAHLFGPSLQPRRGGSQTRHYETNVDASDAPNEISAKRLFLLNLIRRWTAFRINAGRCLNFSRKTATSLAFALLVVFSCHAGSASAITGGRNGGSFGGTKRYSSTSRLVPRSSKYRYNRAPAIGTPLHGSFYELDVFPARRERFSPRDLFFFSATTAVIVYCFKDSNSNRSRRGGPMSPLGPGATVAQVTMSLNVRDRSNPNSILNRLADISQQHDTNFREGVQSLVSEVAMELLRQEDSIVSADAQSKQFSGSGPAQREFERQAVNGRRKVDRETANRLDYQDHPADSDMTCAMVNIKVSIEGDSTRMPYIQSRQDLRYALERIAGDAQVDDCLMSAEIMWTPEHADDRLTPDDIYNNYPNLLQL